MCSRSPASISVEPRGSSASSSRTITLTSASRGRPSWFTIRPTMASFSAHRELEHLGAELPDRAHLDAAGAEGPARRWSRPGARASGSNVAPCSSVEVSTTKKTMLKNRSALGIPSITGKVASTTGNAPRRPAQLTRATREPGSARSAWPATRPRGAPRTSARRSGSARRTATSPNSLGKTSRPRVRNSAIWLTQARPSWKSSTVRLPGIARAAQRQAREVDGHEARAVQHVGQRRRRAGGRDRRHGVEAGGRERHALEGRDRGQPDASADDRADRQLDQPERQQVHQRRSRAPGCTR